MHTRNDAYKKWMKESIHSKLITKSNDNVLLIVCYYVRLFTILTHRYNVMNILCGILFYKDVVL
jgi:hypothetical protein